MTKARWWKRSSRERSVQCRPPNVAAISWASSLRAKLGWRISSARAAGTWPKAASISARMSCSSAMVLTRSVAGERGWVNSRRVAGLAAEALLAGARATLLLAEAEFRRADDVGQAGAQGAGGLGLDDRLRVAVITWVAAG